MAAGVDEVCLGRRTRLRPLLHGVGSTPRNAFPNHSVASREIFLFDLLRTSCLEQNTPEVDGIGGLNGPG